MANEEKKPPQITEDDVGEYVEDKNGEIWKIISYTENPTFCIEKYGTKESKEREHFVVGAPITKNLTKLKRERQDGEEESKKS